MRILKQPSGYDFEQPFLNKILRVHVALMYSANSRGRSSISKTYYDSKTRSVIPYSNWRAKLIRKLGT